MKKLFFIIPLTLSISMMGCSTDTNQEENQEISNHEIDLVEQVKTIEDVNVEKFAALIEKGEGQVLDVRTPEEWQSGVIKGAIKINFYDSNFKEQIGKLDKKRPVFVYCKAGGRSAGAAKQLQESGFNEVYNLLGGITAWDAANKELDQ